MDSYDLALLRELERDGRQSFAGLADNVGLSKTPCWTRVQDLERKGIITGYGARVNPRRLGLGVYALVQVMIDFSRREEFERAVLQNDTILECYTTAGEADYVLKILCRDVDGLDDLLRFTISLLPGLQRSTSMIWLKAVKENGSVTGVLDAARGRVI